MRQSSSSHLLGKVAPVLTFVVLIAMTIGAVGLRFSSQSGREMVTAAELDAMLDSFPEPEIDSARLPDNHLAEQDAGARPADQPAGEQPSDEENQAARDASSLAGKASEILDVRCGDCHSGPKRQSNLFDVGRQEWSRVVRAGNPDESLLFHQVTNGEMPPDEPLPSEETELIRKWIASMSNEREFLSLRDELSTIVSDIESLPAETGLNDFVYVSTRILSNRGDVSDEKLDQARLAIGKCINSLHWQPRLILPTPINAAGTLYRISISELRWDRDTIESILQASPYQSIPQEFHSDRQIRRAARRLVRADWFVKQLTSTEVYHALIYDKSEMAMDVDNDDLSSTGAFQTLDGLLDILRLNYAREFRQGRIQRSYIDKGGRPWGSEVSRNYRVLDQLETIFGPFWISFDFGRVDGLQDVRKNPAGPSFLELNGGKSFAQDGGEVIFQLPNGLHAYLIVDGSGQRLDQAPVHIVHDLDGAPISTGLDCIRCHAQGFRDAKTFLPTSVESLSPTLARFSVLSTEELSMNAESDSQPYRRAVGELTREMGLMKSVETQRAIGNLIQDYNENVDFRQLAVEFDSPQVPEPVFQSKLADYARKLEAVQLPNASASALNDDLASLRYIRRADIEMIFKNAILAFGHQTP